MDQNQPVNTDFEILKKQIEKDLAIELLTAVRDKKLDEEKLKLTAKEVLNEFKKITTQENIASTLQTIAQKWPFLSNIVTKIKFDSQSKSEKEVIDKLSSYIKDLN